MKWFSRFTDESSRALLVTVCAAALAIAVGLWLALAIEPDNDTDGWTDASDSNAFSRAVMNWGDPQHTTGDLYTAEGPVWWLGSEKAAGEWYTMRGTWPTASRTMWARCSLIWIEQR